MLNGSKTIGFSLSSKRDERLLDYNLFSMLKPVKDILIISEPSYSYTSFVRKLLLIPGLKKKSTMGSFHWS